MHNLTKTIEYLSEYFSSHYKEYFELMVEAGSARYPETYKGESDVIQGIRNIVHNISDTYPDLSIPKGFASPNLLLDSLNRFRNLAEEQLNTSLKINDNLGNPWYTSISYSVKINSEVMEAVDYGLSLSKQQDSFSSSPLLRLEKLLDKLPVVASELSKRRKNNGIKRPTLEITDEYDVQDLIRSLLYIEFDDIRSEEWCPSYAGSSKRTDFLLKAEKIVLEIKKTRSDHNSKKIGEELIIDIENYKNHPDCSRLVCFVWDKDKRIENPNGLKVDLEKSNPDLVTVLIFQ